MVKLKPKFFAFFLVLFSFFGLAQGIDQHHEQDEIVDSIVAASKDGNVSPEYKIPENYSTNDVVTERNFTENFRNKYKGDDYNYTTIKPKTSLWERIAKRLQKIFDSIFGKVNFDKTNEVTALVLRIFAILLVAFLLYFLIKYLLTKDGNWFFSKSNRKVEIQENDLNEDIHAINFETSIAEFERTGNYRFAVRYRFLQLLKKLADKNIIDWNTEKTNKDYVAEMSKHALNSEFRDVSKIFEYVWYGEFEVNRESYNKFRQKFENIRP